MSHPQDKELSGEQLAEKAAKQTEQSPSAPNAHGASTQKCNSPKSPKSWQTFSRAMARMKEWYLQAEVAFLCLFPDLITGNLSLRRRLFCWIYQQRNPQLRQVQGASPLSRSCTLFSHMPLRGSEEVTQMPALLWQLGGSSGTSL